MIWQYLKRFALVLVLSIGIVGCGNDRGLVPVHGTVTMEGKPVPHSGTVRFLPTEVDDETPRRAAYGKFDVDGSYEAQSFEPGDGLFPGTYVVTVECWKAAPSLDENGTPTGINGIHKKFQNPNKSGFEIVISKGDSAKTFDLDLQPPE